MAAQAMVAALHEQARKGGSSGSTPLPPSADSAHPQVVHEAAQRLSTSFSVPAAAPVDASLPSVTSEPGPAAQALPANPASVPAAASLCSPYGPAPTLAASVQAAPEHVEPASAAYQAQAQVVESRHMSQQSGSFSVMPAVITTTMISSTARPQAAAAQEVAQSLQLSRAHSSQAPTTAPTSPKSAQGNMISSHSLLPQAVADSLQREAALPPPSSRTSLQGPDQVLPTRQRQVSAPVPQHRASGVAPQQLSSARHSAHQLGASHPQLDLASESSAYSGWSTPTGAASPGGSITPPGRKQRPRMYRAVQVAGGDAGARGRGLRNGPGGDRSARRGLAGAEQQQQRHMLGAAQDPQVST